MNRQIAFQRAAYISIFVAAAAFCTLCEWGDIVLPSPPLSISQQYALDLGCIIAGVGFTWLALRLGQFSYAKRQMETVSGFIAVGWVRLALWFVALWGNAAAYYLCAFPRNAGYCLLIAAAGGVFLWPAKPKRTDVGL